MKDFERESGAKFAFPARGSGSGSGSQKSSSSSSESSAASTSTSTTQQQQLAALAELAAALRGDGDEARVLAAASLEPAPFVALYLAIFSSDEGEESSRRRLRFAAAAREVEMLRRKV